MIFSKENVIIYLRKSRSDDPAMSISDVLAKHEYILNEFTQSEYGFTLPEERIFREVVSGETISGRPMMQQIMKLIENDEIKAVIVVEPQRLSRGDLEDCGRIINTFRYTNTLVVTPNKTYNLNEEYDRKFFEMELSRGNDYLEYTKKILQRGRTASVRKGNYIGSVAPYGYNKVIIGTGKDASPTLSINESEAAAVRVIFNMYANNGVGFAQIAHHLDSLGIIPRNGKNNWSAATIAIIISNPIYIGKVRWNHRAHTKKIIDGTLTTSRPINSEPMLIDGKHPAIIDEDTFYKCQNLRNLKPSIKKAYEMRNSYCGLVICGKCGHSMQYKQCRQKRKDGTYSTQINLICPNQRNCHSRSVNMSEFEKVFIPALKDEIDNFKIKLRLKKDDSYEKSIELMESELIKLKARDSRQKDAYEDGLYTKSEYLLRNAKLQEKIEQTKAAISDLKTALPKKIDFKNKLIQFTECLEKLQDETVSCEKKNSLLKNCVKKIEYNTENEAQTGIGRYVKNSFKLNIFFIY